MQLELCIVIVPRQAYPFNRCYNVVIGSLVGKLSWSLFGYEPEPTPVFYYNHHSLMSTIGFVNESNGLLNKCTQFHSQACK
jgi:hypothetical protein